MTLASISKATTLYLMPALMLTSLFLILFAYLAPAVMLHNQVSLLTVTPSSVLTQPGTNLDVDGPSILLGLLGSCSRPNSEENLICTSPSIYPQYNTLVFTSNTPSSVLAAPPTAAVVFLAMSLTASVVFFVLFTGISFRHLMGKAGGVFDRPMIQQVSAWVGIASFLVGLATFLIIRMYFGKAADDFNLSIEGQGTNGPQLIANTSNAFIMIWVGYALFGVPVVISLAKLHVLATK